ncbi:MAG: NADAR family protein [Patescibacteria group bacterium]
MYPDSSEGLNYENKSEIAFFTPAFDALSNWSAHTVTIWGKTFPTAEHAFQSAKFDPNTSEYLDILNAKSPWSAFQLARQNQAKVRPDWREVRLKIMEEILSAKAQEHEDVRMLLKKSGNRNIIENHPVDEFWGIGKDGKGQNNMGKIWMKVRAHLSSK